MLDDADACAMIDDTLASRHPCRASDLEPLFDRGAAQYADVGIEEREELQTRTYGAVPAPSDVDWDWFANLTGW